MLSTLSAFGTDDSSNQSSYKITTLVANKAIYKPQILDKSIKNAWGIAIRPAGAGGHFWVAGGDISFQYVGDVSKSNDLNLKKLHVDNFPYMKLNLKKDAAATGIVFNGGSSFIVQQSISGKKDLVSPAKFIFSADDGSIHAWTERKNTNLDGSISMDWPLEAKKVIQEQDAQFFGIGMNEDFSRLYAADFGKNPSIRTYDGNFKPVNITFDMPFDINKNNKVDAGEYAPFNIQYLKDSNNKGHLLVAYAQTKACPTKAIKEKICAKGEIEPGEENSKNGKIAEFDENGRLISIWSDKGMNAPWGMAYAPSTFGKYANHLLVANFTTGLISIYETNSKEFVGYLKDKSNKNLKIDGIWGLQFGNGASLGDSDTLYFAAGPKDEEDGVFGSIKVQK